MEMPNVATDVRDAEREVTYRVVAYRQLSREEAITYVRLHLQRQKRKPKRGSLITIVTTVGAND